MKDTVVNDIITIINEEFYLLDIAFDPNYCDILFGEIYNGFVESKQEEKAYIEMLKFVKKVISTVGLDGEYDYTLFFNKINLLPLNFIRKQKIHNAIEKQINKKKTS